MGIDPSRPVDRLVVTVEATHESLEARLRAATAPVAPGAEPRTPARQADQFLVAVSRHVAAAEEVLVPPVARRLPDGAAQARAYLHRARALEHAAALAKARVYGEVHARHVPWAEVWDDVRRALERHDALEAELVAALADALGPAETGRLAERILRAEVRAPTRPHPYLPHRGPLGRLARRTWAVADRFWDVAENREVPPVLVPHPRPHAHDSLLAQYLIGEPLLDRDAPVVQPRRPRQPRLHRRWSSRRH